MDDASGIVMVKMSGEKKVRYHFFAVFLMDHGSLVKFMFLYLKCALRSLPQKPYSYIYHCMPLGNTESLDGIYNQTESEGDPRHFPKFSSTNNY